MTAYAIVPATIAHCAELAANMTPENAAECAALGHTPAQAVNYSYLVSREPMTMLADDRVLAIYGIMTPTILSTVASPWILATDVREHGMWFLRQSRRIVGEWRRQYKSLANYVDARHTVSVRWVRWMGYTLEEPQPFGPHGVPFMRFSMEGV